MSGGDGRVGLSGAGTAAGAARRAGSLRAGAPGADTARAGSGAERVWNRLP